MVSNLGLDALRIIMEVLTVSSQEEPCAHSP